MEPKQHPPAIKAYRSVATAIAIVGAASGCATGPDRVPEDPLEPLNRATFTFNDALDRNVARPVAERYNQYTPRPLRTAIGNFFSNLSDVPVMVNNFLQLRIGDGLSDIMRLATNTVFGLGGLIDIATPAGIPKHDQDFGLTLAHYGVPSGPYLVLPIFGPSDFRDAVGFGVDQYAYPLNYADVAWRNSLWGLNFVSTRARYLGATQLLEEAALDKYTFTRDAFLGQRRYKASEGKEQALPNYEQPAPAGQPVPQLPEQTAPPPKPAGQAPGQAAPAGKPADQQPGQAAPAGKPAGQGS
jgi:phospholipid-binding lipoprotein MlaA